MVVGSPALDLVRKGHGGSRPGHLSQYARGQRALRRGRQLACRSGCASVGARAAGPSIAPRPV